VQDLTYEWLKHIKVGLAMCQLSKVAHIDSGICGEFNSFCITGAC